MGHTKLKLKATPINTLANAKTGKQIAVITKGGRPEKEITAITRRLAFCWNCHDDLLKAGEELRDALLVVLKNIDGKVDVGPIQAEAILLAQQNWDEVSAKAAINA